MKDLTFFIIIGTIIVSFALTGGAYVDGLFHNFTWSTPSTSGGYTLATQQPTAAPEKNLQLRTPVFITGTPPVVPTSTAACSAYDQGLACNNPTSCEWYAVTCTTNTSGKRVCADVWNNPQNTASVADANHKEIITCADVDSGDNYDDANNLIDKNGWCDSPKYAGDGVTTCMGKPVIYLYPTTATYVDVFLSVPGEIIASIPHYPEEGWQDVLAHPDGTLEYQGKTYPELFYESEIAHVLAPQNGKIIPKSELSTQIPLVLYQFGLNKKESDAFMEFWLPKLLALKGNYVQFSLFDKAYKERLDGVHISPEPDTRIELLGYFKPLAAPIAIDPIILPQEPPKRVGFTEVEWGATIDTGTSLIF